MANSAVLLFKVSMMQLQRTRKDNKILQIAQTVFLKYHLRHQCELSVNCGSNQVHDDAYLAAPMTPRFCQTIGN